MNQPQWHEPTAEDAEQTQADVRGVLAAVGYSAPRESAWLGRIDRVLLHPVGGIVVLAVVMFLIFQAVFSWATPLMDGIKEGMAGLGGWVAANMPPRAAHESARRRRDRGRGRRARVPAADRDPVLLHPRARGFRLPAARRLSTRPVDGLGGPFGPRVHPAAVEPCVRDPRHHGDAHDPELARPSDHDHDRAAHDLLGAPAGVWPADRRIHSRARRRHFQSAGAGAVRAVCRRHPLVAARRIRREAVLRADRAIRR